jgi:hypothetical protein
MACLVEGFISQIQVEKSFSQMKVDRYENISFFELLIQTDVVLGDFQLVVHKKITNATLLAN